MPALVEHKDPNVTYGYLRDVHSLLFGDARTRLHGAVVELGFEPYQVGGRYAVGTLGRRRYRNGAEPAS